MKRESRIPQSITALSKMLYTLEEYLELDKHSDERFEYFDGEVFPMSGGSVNHERIVRNLIRRLDEKLEGSPCEAFSSNLRLKVPTAAPYRYPDVTVVCGEVQTENLQGQELVLNPQVIIEVLSHTTENYDLGAKFTEYQSIPSFREYVVFAQNAARVIHHLRQPDDKWLRTDIIGIGASVMLETLGITLALRDVYRHVKFTYDVL